MNQIPSESAAAVVNAAKTFVANLSPSGPASKNAASSAPSVTAGSAGGATSVPGGAASLPNEKTADSSPIPTAAATAAQMVANAQQAFVAGNNVIAFDIGVTSARRVAAVNSTAFAQLAADTQHQDRTAPGYVNGWTAAYVETLLKLGWDKQQDTPGSERLNGATASVQSKILSLAATLIGTSGVGLIEAALKGLSQLTDGNSAFVIFKQASSSANIYNFTVGLGSNDANGSFLLDLLEYEVMANEMDSQVLFFDWSTTNALINYRKMVFALSDEVWNEVAATVEEKLRNEAAQFVSEIRI